MVFGLLFLLGAAVQYNDPDPLRWISIYLAASLTSFARVRGRLPWVVPAIVGLCALAWAATLAPQVLERGEFTAMFGAWEMANDNIETSREFWGLITISAWMAALAAFPQAGRAHRYRS